MLNKVTNCVPISWLLFYDDAVINRITFTTDKEPGMLHTYTAYPHKKLDEW
ncbi:MAG TPA: hypothetical protein VK483_12125 [Chitinophagaceae bacterium]|nr:hypothetical protein [Chitinophagaceae bacterium]